jgi:hypothetical protein
MLVNWRRIGTAEIDGRWRMRMLNFEGIRRVLFAAHVDYLHAALDQIAHDYGDILGFLRNEIGVNAGMRLKMHAAL